MPISLFLGGVSFINGKAQYKVLIDLVLYLELKAERCALIRSIE